MKVQAALILFTALMITSLANHETWIFPFQAVVTTFRLCVFISIALYIYGIANDSLLLISSALFVSCITLFLHGGGILLPLVLSFSGLLQARWRYVFLPLLLYILFFGINHWSDSLSPQMGLSQMGGMLLKSNFLELLSTTASNTVIYLGYQIGGRAHAAIIGGLGVTMAVILFLQYIVQFKVRSMVENIWATLLVFSFMSAVLASLLLTFGIINNTRDAGIIYSNRYIAIAGIFWISLSALLLPKLPPKLGLSIACLLCLLAGASFIKWHPYTKAHMNSIMSKTDIAIREAKIGHVPKEKALFLFQPSQESEKVDAVIEFYRINHLNIFSD